MGALKPGPLGGVFAARAASDVPLVVRGASGQTANLQEWQDATGAVKSSIGATGTIVSAGGPVGGIAAYFAAAGPTSRPVVVIGAASQTANLQEWQDSTGAVKAAIAQDGVAKFLSITGSHVFGPDYGLNSRVAITTTAATAGLTVRGAPSQQANLQEWQNSAGSALAAVNASGGGTFGAVASGDYGSTFGTGVGSADNAVIRAGTGQASVKGLVVKGAASQTANLQEWQNNVGGVMAKVASNGQIVARYAAFGGVSIDGQDAAGAFGPGNQTTMGLMPAASGAAALVIRGLSGQSQAPLVLQRSDGSTAQWLGPIGQIQAIGTTGAGCSDGDAHLMLGSRAAPTANPVNGGLIYCNGTQMRWRGSNGVDNYVTG